MYKYLKQQLEYKQLTLKREQNRAMPHKQALRVAHKYLTGKRGQPDGTKPRLLILLGGSGAGKSTMISNLSKASDGYVDPKHPEWVMSGLDEFIE